MANITNREAKRNFEIIDTLSAGISLLGPEVKSIRNGRGSLVGASVVIKSNEVFLIGADIPPFQPKNVAKDYNPKRERKLLLSKKDIHNLIMKTEAKNLYLVPVSVYNKGNKLKLEVGIGRKLKVADKREKIKKRDSDREIGRRLKRTSR